LSSASNLPKPHLVRILPELRSHLPLRSCETEPSWLTCVKGMTFSPVIQTFIPNEHLHWRGRLMNVPWLFTGHHHFELHPIESGTRFEQSEYFSGILALVLSWIGSDMYGKTERGFRLMNDALKERVEGNRSSDKLLKQRVGASVKTDGLSDI